MQVLAWLAACASLIATQATAASLIDLSVQDRTANKALPVYASSAGRFVAGTPGNEYSLRLRNRSGSDVLAVVSVDGVNVLSGESASPDQGGYVIPAYGALEIKGWRKSLERVVAFYFTDLGDSYAARTGRPDDVGVIGVAVFERKPLEIDPAEEPHRSLRRQAPAAASGRADANAEADAKLGTGHGRSEASSARVVSFERATSTPAQVIALRYDSRRNLLAMGVIPSRPRRPDPFPDPFPGGFTPDPQ